MRETASLDQQLSASRSAERQAELRQQLQQWAGTAADVDACEVQSLTGDLLDLLAFSETFSESLDEYPQFQSVESDCTRYTNQLENWLKSYPDSRDAVRLAHEELQAKWGEYLDLLPECDRYTHRASSEWEITPTGKFAEAATENDLPLTEAELTQFDMAGLLSVLQSEAAQPNVPLNAAEHCSALSAFPPQPALATAESLPAPEHLLKQKAAVETLDDPELLPAYLDDAQGCLAGMERCLIELEKDSTAVEPLRLFCRELHTLKGASGTVGLNGLAESLHQLETEVERMSKGEIPLKIDALLLGVDQVRDQLQVLHPEGGDSAQPLPENSSATGSGNREQQAETYVRIESSRLDRMMDLLAELVMLRNRRDSYASSLQNLHRELNGCATRIRLIDTFAPIPEVGPDATPEPNHADQLVMFEGHSRGLALKLSELAKDVSDLGRSLQQTCDPLAQDNTTISHLIGNFRSELMELRRQPIAGLFRRLSRVVRDAGKVEGRTVDAQFIGQATRAERSLQERLFEPLMHILRNAVSHGIESPEERAAQGKSPAGQLTVTAQTDSTALYLEIRDDGRGLNEAVLERRGREMGLITGSGRPSREQLWELILKPGFSTKQEVSQISGRGIGMDVVASQIQSMRGRIHIDSVPGQYTAFRLEIPLRSTIEHAMVVRCSGQLFAIPMHSVAGTQNEESPAHTEAAIPLAVVLGQRLTAKKPRKLVSLRTQSTPRGEQTPGSPRDVPLTIAVDAVVGVEEVVVRSLPRLLSQHECFSGVTLSGEAETVLVLDVPRLVEIARATQVEHEAMLAEEFESEKASRHSKTAGKRGNHVKASRILIVDDSVSVRRNLARKFKDLGVLVAEATDGRAALDLLREGQIWGVITDLDMPRMNGQELIAELQRHRKWENLPVVVVTGRKDPKQATALEELGVCKVFTKPVTDTMIRSILQELRLPKKSVSDAEACTSV